MKNISSFIKKYRQKNATLVFYNEAVFITSILLLLLICILYIEQIFYLSSENRKLYIIFYTAFLATTFFYSILKWIISYYSLFNNNTDEIISKKIGDLFPNIKDKLLNVIQLNKISPNLDLTKLAIKNVAQQLSTINRADLDLKINFKKNKPLLFIILISLILTNSIFKDSLSRVINHNKYFPPPLPFTIESTNTKFEALSGDTLEINFTGVGDLPDSINFHWINTKQHKVEKIAKIDNDYYFTFNNIRSNISYWVEKKPDFLISSWDSIGTKINQIKVKERPKIITSNFKIIPPKYIDDDTQFINDSNSNQIKALNESTIFFDFITNKNLKQAWMLLDDQRIYLKTNKNKITGDFIFNDNSTLTIFCLDENSVPNLNPTQYTLTKIKDNAPIQSIYLPFSEFEIDESYEIIVNMNVNDDYEIKNTYIEYEIISTESYLNNSLKGKWELFNKDKHKIKNININKILDISNINLSMGDEIHFWFISEDYINTTKSNKFIGRFPTLEDMFSKIEAYEEENNEWVEDIQESINEIFDATNEAKLDIIKEKNLTIEKENNIENSIEKVDEIFEELEKIQDNIEKIQDKAESNYLFDKDLMNKFDHFQQLLQNMMTPEMLEAMKKLQEAMQNMDQNELLNALENFEFNMEQLEDELDKFIEMFEMAQAEQKLEELNQSIQNMLDKQNSLIEEIASQPDKNKMLTSKSNKQESRFEEFEQLLDETKQVIESLSKECSSKIQELSNSSIMPKTKNNLNNTTNELSNNKIDEAQKKSIESKDGLNEIAEQINEIKENFKNETKEQLSKEFILIIDNLITISNQEEKVIYESKSLKSKSPQLRQINSEQNNINKELDQLMKAMISLSNKTFFMKPIIGKTFGKIKSAITNAIANFEQKKIFNGKKNQLQALSNINKTIQLLLEALNEMQNSEQPSGFDQFIESLESISKKQQGINQGTMQLSQLGLMQQQGLMEQLQNQQQKLKEELSDLLGEQPGQNNGTMEKITNDMDDVIQDFSNKNVTQKTIERQEQIISRMLDNQKSLAQRDFSDQRKSKSSEQFEFTGSYLLPDNLGQNNLLLINAMENAMKEGHSKEYNQLIRNYFLNLQKKINEK